MAFHRLHFPSLGLLLVGISPPATLAAQDPLPITRLTSPINLDGKVNEASWLAIAPLPMVTYLPTAGKSPSDSTEIRLAYDQEFLYASARCFVGDPHSISATSLQRDRLGADDRFRLMLDTYIGNNDGVPFIVPGHDGLVDRRLVVGTLNTMAFVWKPNIIPIHPINRRFQQQF